VHTHKIGSDDGGSDGGTRSLVLTMENDGAEVTHRNRCIGPKLDLLREKGYESLFRGLVFIRAGSHKRIVTLK